MSLPKHIQAQQKAVESYDEQLKKEQLAASEPEPEAKPEEESNEPKEAQKQPTQDLYDPKDPRHETLEYWRDRCNVIAGKYSAEVPRLTSQLAARDNEIELLKKQIESANDDLISPEQREEYGEYADLVESTVRKTTADTTAKLAETSRKIDDFQAEKAQAKIDTFYSGLAKEIPNWQAINTSDSFNDRLEEIDPLSGQTFKSLLVNASDSLDLNRVVYFFKKFGEPGKQSTPKTPESVLPEKRYVGNEEARDGYMTREEIKTFYDDIQRGKYRGRQVEVDAMELKIAQASKQGRII